jgi:hypothetical protein
MEMSVEEESPSSFSSSSFSFSSSWLRHLQDFGRGRALGAPRQTVRQFRPGKRRAALALR